MDFCIDEIKHGQEDKNIINVCVKEINSKIAIKVECTWNKLNQYKIPIQIQEKYKTYLNKSNHDNIYIILILFK